MGANQTGGASLIELPKEGSPVSNFNYIRWLGMGLPITSHTDCTIDMLADPLIEADVLTML